MDLHNSQNVNCILISSYPHEIDVQLQNMFEIFSHMDNVDNVLSYGKIMMDESIWFTIYSITEEGHKIYYEIFVLTNHLYELACNNGNISCLIHSYFLQKVTSLMEQNFMYSYIMMAFKILFHQKIIDDNINPTDIQIIFTDNSLNISCKDFLNVSIQKSEFDYIHNIISKFGALIFNKLSSDM